jgi:hypothetical protein
MYKVIVVDAPWSKRKGFLTGAVVAAISVLLGCALSWWDDAWGGFGMPVLLFVPLFVAILLLYPIAALVLSYRRLPHARLALVYMLGFVFGWYMTIEFTQAAEYGLWKGMEPDKQTALNLMFRQAQSLLAILAVCIPAGMGVWGLCRLLRGKALVQDGSMCAKCGYNLTGNESGVCPECGTPCAPPAKPES